MRVYLPLVSLAHVLRRFAERFGLAVLLVLVANAFEEQAHGGPLAPGVDRLLDLLLDDVELDLLDGERLIGGRSALLFDHRAAALQRFFQAAVEFFGLRRERFPIVFEPADLVVGQERREVGFGAMLADGGRDFASDGGSLLAQIVGFVELGGQLAQFLLVGDAAFLEQRLATTAIADRGLAVLDRFDPQRLCRVRGCSLRCSTRCECVRARSQMIEQRSSVTARVCLASRRRAGLAVARRRHPLSSASVTMRCETIANSRWRRCMSSRRFSIFASSSASRSHWPAIVARLAGVTFSGSPNARSRAFQLQAPRRTSPRPV